MSMFEYDNQFGDWGCSVKNGLIEEIYQNDDMFFNAQNVEGYHDYNRLCSFDYNMTVAAEVYSLHILFPNCHFSSENELIIVRLIKGDDLIDNNNYQISFSQESEGITGADVNHDQNMKMDFFVNLISNDAMNMLILDVDGTTLALDGLQKAMSSPLCM